MTDPSLAEKIKKVQALFEGSANVHEKDAAAKAMERLQAQLVVSIEKDVEEEFQFSMPDQWSKKVFCALLRRYNIKPYRYRRQKHTTVVARMKPAFCDQVIWPEFQEISQLLREHLDTLADDVIKQCIFPDTAEAEAVRALPPD